MPLNSLYIERLIRDCHISVQDSALDMMASQQNKAAGGWMDTILNLIPGRKQQASNEPSEESIKRTHEFLRSVPGICCQFHAPPHNVLGVAT